MPDRHNLKQLELHLDRPIRSSDSTRIRNIMAASYWILNTSFAVSFLVVDVTFGENILTITH